MLYSIGKDRQNGGTLIEHVTVVCPSCRREFVAPLKYEGMEGEKDIYSVRVYCYHCKK